MSNKRLEKERKNQQNIREEERRCEVKQQQTLHRLNNNNHLKRVKQDEQDVAKVERRIVEYVRTQENQRRYRIANRKDHNQKLRSIKNLN